MTVCIQHPNDILDEVEWSLGEMVAPPPQRTALDWVESEDGPFLSERTSGISGKLNLDITPYLRLPLEKFSDSFIERMALCFGTQSGKTTFLECILGYIIDHDPGPTMFVRPTMNEAMEFSRDRMMPFILDCESLSRHVVGRIEDELRPLEYRFDRMTMRYAWSQSEVSVRGRPIRYLIKDESSAYAPGASALADERTKTFWNRKIVETSTPSQDTDTIWRFMGLKRKNGIKPEEIFSTESYVPETATTVYFYEVPCPHCGKYIRLEATQLRWPKDIPLRDIEGVGWYECQICGGKITDGDKAFALRKARWHTNNPGGRWVGFHLGSIYAPWASCRFGAVAFEMMNARFSGDYEVMKSFVNNWLALPYSLEDLGSDVITLTSVERSKMVRYFKNEIPEPVRVLTLGADVQGDKIYWVVLGWSSKNADDGSIKIESWVISWGETADFVAFETEVIEREWVHATGARMRVVCGGIDGRYRTAEVKAFCAKHKHISVVFGEQTIKSSASTTALPFSATRIDRDSKGKPLDNSRIGYRINTIYWKQWLYQRINKIGDATEFHLPSDDNHDSKNLVRHLSSEVEVSERVRGSTAIKRVWKVRKGYEANHWLDGTVYASAVSSIKGIFTMSGKSELIGVVSVGDPKKKEEPRMRPRLFERKKI